MNRQAYIIRCAPSRISRLDEIIPNKQIVLGWSLTKNKLFKSSDREFFKQQLKESYPTKYKKNPYSLGQATGHLWRFIREMQKGDYAIVPTSKAFYLGKIKNNELQFYEDKIEDDTAIRRDVEWLNDGKPILRDFCGAGLVSRLKYQGTCVSATDLIEDIEEALKSAKQNTKPTFKNQLGDSLKGNVAKLLTSKKAYLDNTKLEKLVRQLLLALGAKTSKIPYKKRYPGSIADVDVIANFVHLGLHIYVQVKKHSGETDEHAVKQIIEALKIDNPDNSKPIFGWVISTGTFSDEAEKLAIENGIRIIDKDELAEIIISVGLDNLNEN